MKNLKLIACVLPFILFPILFTGCDSKDEPRVTTTSKGADGPSVEQCKQVKIGMTTDQVKAILGEPGGKDTYNGVLTGYHWCIENCDAGIGMFKASFEDGKVSKVEFPPGVGG